MTSDGEREFKTEVDTIGRTNHKNLVQFIGFYNEGQHRLLVYEFMPNGSLADFLFGGLRPSWFKRIEIACGVARGLLYLHEECSTQIIHCDIKPQNILLDESLTAKICDFGLAKLLMGNQTRTVTAVRGTKGYLAPEWFRNMPVSVKVDVYSFGILLLELICCRKSCDFDLGDEARMILSDWVYDCYHGGRLNLIVEGDEGALGDMKRVRRFVMIALWCIQEDPSLRPPMKKVAQMLDGAVEVSMPERDVISWTAMICGYCNKGKIEEGLILFERLKLEGLEPNAFTWNAMIASCARMGDRAGAMSIFSRMKNEGLLSDLVTWNALISGFVQSHQPGEALRLLGDMLASGAKPNQVTVTGLLPACGLMGAIQTGREIHGLIYRLGLDWNVYVASALIDMYSKCGNVENAKKVFAFGAAIKNVASWNAMIGCYGKHGMINELLQLFETMIEETLPPNGVTFVSVLSACSHGGLVEKGVQILQSMRQNYGDIKLQREHYACVVDLLCRSGRMIEAYKLVKEMSLDVTESILGAFFNGCIVHDRKDLAELMVKDVNERLEMKKPGGFVALSNIYAAGGEWEGVENVRKVMKEKWIRKVPAYSLVEKSNSSIDSYSKEMNKCP